jgi:hypothetical protein
MDIDTVRELDRARVSAMLKGDVEAIASHLDYDLIYIHSTGVVDTRESYLESLSSSSTRPSTLSESTMLAVGTLWSLYRFCRCKSG